jgi:tetratricopeptide (TPR) repeat protein
MGDLWIQVLTRTDRDLDRLLDAFHPKVVAEDIIGYQARISAEPDSAPLHDDVALLYLDQGNARKAVEHFERSAQLRPGSARAQFNLGTALAFGGALDAAMEHYRRALALDPDYALAHNNLGGLLLQRGDVANARQHLERALALDPSNADVQFNAGRLYRQTGDPRACASFGRALAARPGWEAARSELASCR